MAVVSVGEKQPRTGCLIDFFVSGKSCFGPLLNSTIARWAKASQTAAAKFPKILSFCFSGFCKLFY